LFTLKGEPKLLGVFVFEDLISGLNAVSRRTSGVHLGLVVSASRQSENSEGAQCESKSFHLGFSK
jgi:hypothetical protein